MTDIIRLLPDHVANQIAAGEVIQRPASAVKELLENAIDAKATEIKLIIKDAGKTLVQVIDNGIGMSVTDARLAFERHATSKIQKAEDLFHLQTKGFRGEALASIAAIAHVELITKRPSDELGTELRIEGSKVTYQEPCVTANGTSIAMKNLFFNIPARRNFLKSDSVELRHILDEFHRVALAHPNIHFYLYNNGNELFNLPIANFRQRIVHIFGAKTNEKLVPVEEETPILKISGFIVKPEYITKSKSLQFLMVNHRFVKSRYLNHAITIAYEGLINSQQQPDYFIQLEVDPSSIDINIHPTKTEVKFEDEHSIYALLKSAVKHSLGQFNIAPTLDFNRDASFDIPYNYKDKEPIFPKIEIDPDFNPFKEEIKSKNSYSNNYSYHSKKQPAWESLYSEIDSGLNNFEPQVIESKLFDAEPQFLQTGKKTIFLGNKYLVTTLGGELVVVNIHRAHQRVLYEEFIKTLQSSSTASQQLMFPIELFFSKPEIEIILNLKQFFEDIGFIIDIESDRVILTGIPLHISDSQIPEVFSEIVHQHTENVYGAENSQKETFAKSISKNLAVKTGQTLTEEEQETLLNNLFACQESLISPFGKRIYTKFSLTDIDKFF
ncbi:DNA mismatch repair endonuclease MutL [Capnocytophaga cynodegmi]|uniref:DNA mismatch repair protein MutL n=1 Tax=Capnocytophaga cynodegmi TaxID=28189 RepID=A0A0B7HGN7_9FLAO|nr:DNA mismatch repair endonuclease MutL [Capnocytophaga cynodegmi]CEN34755.1 DNA mismatch repair protein MutL [Capnocytophaga cynodegmi]CEN38891.1 DNA mismatch repair protein MutL [Capnocytophaga cynodegmi]